MVSARVDENVNANAASGSAKTSSKRKQRSVSVSSLTAAGMLKRGRTDPETVQPSSALRNEHTQELGWRGKSRTLIRSASATSVSPAGYDDDDYSLMDVDMSFGNGMDVDVPQTFVPPPQTKSGSQIDMPPPPAPPVKPKLWSTESGELRTTHSSVASSSTTKPSSSVTGVASASSFSRINTSSSSTTQASSSTAHPTSSSSSTNHTTSSLTRAGTLSFNSNSNSTTTTSMPPATPKSATVLPPPRTPTKSGLRSTGARGTNSNAAQPVSNEKGAPIQTRPRVQARAAPAQTHVQTRPQVPTRPTGQMHLPPARPPSAPHSRPSPPPIPPPSSSLHPHPNSSLHPSHPPPSSSQRPPSQHPPVLGMRRTHTLPLPLASQSSVSGGELPSRQRRFKPPLLAANGNQGVASLPASQSTRNGALVGASMKSISPSVSSGGAARNVSTPFMRNAPPAPAPPPSSSSFSSSSNGDSPRGGGGGYRSSPSSADDSDVCITPGVSNGHGVLVGVQVRRAEEGSRVGSSLGVINSRSDRSAIASKPSYSGVSSKPNNSGVSSQPSHSAITSQSNPSSNMHLPSNAKCAHPDEDEGDNASLMMEDDPNDSSFGEMSFDMDALEETMKMYDWRCGLWLVPRRMFVLDTFSLVVAAWCSCRYCAFIVWARAHALHCPRCPPSPGSSTSSLPLYALALFPVVFAVAV